MAKCEGRKSLPTVSKLSTQNFVFYLAEIHGTALKQPIRMDYLIKQNPWDALAGKLKCTEGLHRRGM